MRELLSRTLSEGGEPRWNPGRRMALYRHPKSGTPVRSRDYAELLYMVRGSSRHRIGTTDVELAEGKRLLGETDLSLSQIATVLGFSSPSYFSQSFRSAEGMSPTEYRKANRIRHQGDAAE